LRECPGLAPAGSSDPLVKESAMTLTSLLRTTSKAPLRRIGLLATAAVFALLLGATVPASAQQDDPVIAKVNGVEVRASDLALIEEELGNNVPPIPGAAKREFLLAQIADMIIIAKAAEAKKLADSNDFKRRLQFARNKLLMEMFLQGETKGAVTDAALKKAYEEGIKQIAEDKEVRARHILVESEDEAKAILEEIKKGGDFAELAKQKSKDPSKADGGDLGYFGKDQMVPEFADVAFKLEKGKISDPVKTEFGWHIIKVEDKRDRAVPEFDKVKDQLETYVMRQAQEEILNKLRQAAKVERVEPRSAPAKK
jgi:peptidyl-prolyl cis-trans isomerase C